MNEHQTPLLVEARGSIRILTMNAPDRLNSFDDDLHDAMRTVWDRLADDDSADVVVVTGAGRAFSAGGHVPNFVRLHEDPSYRRTSLRNADRLLRALMACELPIVAAVNGPAVGLGASIATLSDLVVMNEDTYIADPHVSVGVVAGDGGAVNWPLCTGLLRAKEHLLLGDRIDAAECLRIGLASRVVPSNDVLPVAIELAERLAQQPRQAVRDTKRALNLHLLRAADLVLSFALAAEAESFAGEDVRETARRFLAGSGGVV